MFDSEIFSEKIYVSLTSIFNNQNILLQTLKSIVSQSIKPDKIFLCLSEEPYLFDTGFKNKIITDNNLFNFLKDNSSIIEVMWVKNIGSFRKLLPILEEKWNEECVIITIDDDTIYENHLIENLVEDYKKYKCVISYRGFTPKFNKFENFDYLARDKINNLSLYNFPTGKGGILYKPNFFHQTNKLIFNQDIFIKTCDGGDDIWFYILRIKNNIKCFIDNKTYMVKDNTNSACSLFVKLNSKNNKNTIMFQNTLNQINDLLINM
jgi:hypothetical protein